MKVTLRDSNSEDFEFVFNLNKTNMRKYVETVRTWNDEAERADMRQKFTVGVDKIIQVNFEDVGVIRVIKDVDSVKLDHIELLPEFQGKGIGTQLVRDILSENKDKVVSLSVFKGNPAKELYERLGFVVTGEDELKYFLATNV